ncbi:hypothetical protein [Paenibacillus sp. HB172176]|uniref:hypothetical protein n=1 Tax=Paenibacillus sp. HB172176 TaxID=2493690 RepID=UPI00143AA760|nr:hypothetical protein [Paenibacillus sp. HB172176]
MVEGSNFEKRLKEAKKLHHAGTDGDKKAAKIANEKLVKLRRIAPEHALVEAYYGSSLALLARDSMRLPEKEELALAAIEALNHAVAMEPNQKEIRFLRANVSLRLPDDYFHTAQAAIEDFSFLLERYGADSTFLTAKQLKEVLNQLSEAYRIAGHLNKADEILQKLVKLKSEGIDK